MNQEAEKIKVKREGEANNMNQEEKTINMMNQEAEKINLLKKEGEAIDMNQEQKENANEGRKTTMRTHTVSNYRYSNPH